MPEIARPSLVDIGRSAQAEIDALEQQGHDLSMEERRIILARCALRASQPPLEVFARQPEPRVPIASTEEYFKDNQ